KGEVWDVVLHDKGSEAFFNLSGVFYDGEPFYPKKSVNRIGPMGLMVFVVSAGHASLKIDLRKFDQMGPPPDGPLLIWTSKDGLLDPRKEQGFPPWTTAPPPLPPGVDAKVRAAVNKALGDLNVDLAAASIDSV